MGLLDVGVYPPPLPPVRANPKSTTTTTTNDSNNNDYVLDPHDEMTLAPPCASRQEFRVKHAHARSLVYIARAPLRAVTRVEAETHANNERATKQAPRVETQGWFKWDHKTMFLVRVYA